MTGGIFQVRNVAQQDMEPILADRPSRTSCSSTRARRSPTRCRGPGFRLVLHGAGRHLEAIYQQRLQQQQTPWPVGSIRQRRVRAARAACVRVGAVALHAAGLPRRGVGAGVSARSPSRRCSTTASLEAGEVRSYAVARQPPVEVIVAVEGWVQGARRWAATSPGSSGGQLADRRTLIVSAPRKGKVRPPRPRRRAPLVVRGTDEGRGAGTGRGGHRPAGPRSGTGTGQTGFVRVTRVWGLRRPRAADPDAGPQAPVRIWGSKPPWGPGRRCMGLAPACVVRTRGHATGLGGRRGGRSARRDREDRRFLPGHALPPALRRREPTSRRRHGTARTWSLDGHARCSASAADAAPAWREARHAGRRWSGRARRPGGRQAASCRTEVVADAVLPAIVARAALSGPSFAEEVAPRAADRGDPGLARPRTSPSAPGGRC
ncbi:MAG: hypothetical protein MZW92_05125 [Comamonadaceae bacterium]|nr:hypothetical protein [Comamonadaceae bacterium]